ncbi:MAG: acetyl-CoA C-acyltransferase [Bacteroidia bacterium]|jgi:acetyl-CoA C-acetyltransferase
MPKTQPVYLVDACRTPIGKLGGSLAGVRPDDLASISMRALMARNPGFDPHAVEDVVLGAANQAGEDNRNVARMAALLAGLPVAVGGVTVNRLCASGLQALIDAYRAISLGEGDAYIAGGVESMTRAPWVMAKPDQAFSRKIEAYDTTLGWRFTNAALAERYHPYSMGETAENVADRYRISREQQDEFAFLSQSNYAHAASANKFQSEIVPVEIKALKGPNTLFEVDEHPRFSSKEQLAGLKPAFRKDGSVTAGNSSGMNDGAACALLVNESALKTHGLTPMARIVGASAVGVDPAYMGIGPVPAIQRLSSRTGIKISAIDLFELNEAFAAQAVACIQELQIDPSRVNRRGGAIALGHPLGCSGARITTTLVHQMKDDTTVKYGVAALCVGVGQGLAMMLENCA